MQGEKKINDAIYDLGIVAKSDSEHQNKTASQQRAPLNMNVQKRNSCLRALPLRVSILHNPLGSDVGLQKLDAKLRRVA